jgi:6-phosphogluconolactonase
MLHTLTRRRFFALLPAGFAAAASSRAGAARWLGQASSPPEAAGLRVYFGCDTGAGAKGIYTSIFDPRSGHLTAPDLAASVFKPAFFALAPRHPGRPAMLYVCEEGSDMQSATISVWEVEGQSSGIRGSGATGPDAAAPAAAGKQPGSLTQVGQGVSAGFPGPCYIALDHTGRSAYVADYAGSGLASYRVQADGLLSAPVERLDFHNPKFGHTGPNAARQEAPHVHSCVLSPDNRYLLVNDLGNDRIDVFAVDVATAQLTLLPQACWNARPGSGPRHIAFHPNGRVVYCINEIDSTIDTLLWTPGRFPSLVAAAAPVSTLAPGYSGPTNTAAEIAISPEGRYLYASNRGENTLVVFELKMEGREAVHALGAGSAPAAAATLKPSAPAFVQRIACGGNGPRQFTLSPDARWLLCGNQLSGSVTSFSRDHATGHLTGPVQTLEMPAPMFTFFA